MTYRGRMDHGVVVLDGERPADGTLVEVTPLEQQTTADGTGLANHPALGMWKDRKDLPDDPVEASKMLRQKLMRRDDE
jgi:hypothetical protein